MAVIVNKIKQSQFVRNNSVVKKVKAGCSLCRKLSAKPVDKKEQVKYAVKHFRQLSVVPRGKNKAEQICELLKQNEEKH